MTLLREIKKISATSVQLRDFGLVMGGFFAILSLFSYLKEKKTIIIWVSLSVFFCGAAFLLKPVLRILYKPWMGLALILGAVMSRVILTILFIFILCPIGLFLRVSGRDILNKRWQKGGAGSLWVGHKTPVDKKQYESQF